MLDLRINHVGSIDSQAQTTATPSQRPPSQSDQEAPQLEAFEV